MSSFRFDNSCKIESMLVSLISFHYEKVKEENGDLQSCWASNVWTCQPLLGAYGACFDLRGV